MPHLLPIPLSPTPFHSLRWAYLLWQTSQCLLAPYEKVLTFPLPYWLLALPQSALLASGTPILSVLPLDRIGSLGAHSGAGRRQELCSHESGGMNVALV